MEPRHAPYLGYRSALHEAKIREQFVLSVPHKDLGQWEDQDYHVAKEYLARFDQPPTAFVCVGDFRAGPLIRAARDMGLRVPGDLSVVGMGNTPWARWVTPPLTTIAMGEQDIARLAMRLVTDPEMPAATIFRVTPQLIERQSVAELAKHQDDQEQQ
jgi:DNA-binding LacI/PurR family transcriptional regulator